MASKTTAIILAAGRGMRLRPMTETRPKCLVEVGGAPILHRQLKALSSGGIENIVLVVGYMEELIREYVNTHFPHLGIIFVTNPRFAETNTLYSLALAAETVKADAPVMLMNGDVVFDPAIISLFQDSDHNANFIAVQKKQCGEEEIKVKLASDGAISHLNKKLQPADVIGEAIGINRFSPVLWAHLRDSLSGLKDEKSLEYFEHALERAIVDGHRLHALDMGNLPVMEIDFPADLGKAERLFSVTL